MLARFLSPDTVVPEEGDPQSWNRYSYVRNSPVRYQDPTGHYIFEENVYGYLLGEAGRLNPRADFIHGRYGSAPTGQLDFYVPKGSTEAQVINPETAAALRSSHGPITLGDIVAPVAVTYGLGIAGAGISLGLEAGAGLVAEVAATEAAGELGRRTLSGLINGSASAAGEAAGSFLEDGKVNGTKAGVGFLGGFVDGFIGGPATGTGRMLRGGAINTTQYIVGNALSGEEVNGWDAFMSGLSGASVNGLVKPGPSASFWRPFGPDILSNILPITFLPNTGMIEE